MADFGDEIGAEGKNLASRALHYWLRNWSEALKSGGQTYIDEQGQQMVQFPCSSKQEQEALLQMLQDAGFDCKASSVPVINIPEEQREAVIQFIDEQAKLAEQGALELSPQTQALAEEQFQQQDPTIQPEAPEPAPGPEATQLDPMNDFTHNTAQFRPSFDNADIDSHTLAVEDSEQDWQPDRSWKESVREKAEAAYQSLPEDPSYNDFILACKDNGLDAMVSTDGREIQLRDPNMSHAGNWIRTDNIDARFASVNFRDPDKVTCLAPTVAEKEASTRDVIQHDNQRSHARDETRDRVGGTPERPADPTR